MKRFSLFVFLALGFLFGSALAEESVTEPPLAEQLKQVITGIDEEGVAGQTARLLRQLEDAIDDSYRYGHAIPAASHEDSLVLELQFLEAQDRFITTMSQLQSLASKSDADTALVGRLVTIHELITPYLQDRITQSRQAIAELRAHRAATAPADLAALEFRIAQASERLEVLLDFNRKHLQTLRDLGQEPTAGLQAFHELLQELGDELSGRLQLGLMRTGKLNQLAKERPDDTDLIFRQAANRKDLDTTTGTLKVVVDLMNAEGIPDEDLRTQLVSATQDLASGVLDVRITATLARKAYNGMLSWFKENGPGYLLKLLVCFIILGLGWLLSRLVEKAVRKSLNRANLNISQLLKRTIVTFAHNFVLAITVMVALSQFGISLGPLLAGFGVVGFILGFAMQDSLSNFAAGLMILFYRPYDVGDLVEISGVFGKVEHMSMVSTSVLTLDNQKLVVPNSKIWGDVIKNVTDQRVRRVDMTFGISYSDDIPHAEKVLNEILEKCDLVLDEPEPIVRLHTLNESSVDFIVRPWVKTEQYWDVYWAVTREVKMRFDAEKISIPFPQRDVHLYPAAKEGEAEA